MSVPASALSSKEKARLDILNKLVLDGIGTCFQVGAALTEIRDSKLYRDQCPTFEEFCQQNYDFGHRRAAYLMNASEVQKSLQVVDGSTKTGTIGSSLTNERQARALSKVPPEKRAEVLEKAASTGKVTAATISVAAKPKETAVFDKIGCVIPPKILPLWNRGQEVQDMLTQISRIKSAISKGLDEGDPLYAEVSQSSAISGLERLYSELKTAKPYTVCTTCQGRVAEKCSFCQGRGFISEFRWDTMVPIEVKKLRERAVAA